MNLTWAVILAGGSGTRLWPLSTRRHPKQCLEVQGKSLLAETVDRLGMPPDRLLVVTGADMVESVRRALPALGADQVLVEPKGRNTAPAVAWAAGEVKRRGGTAMAVFPSDHHVQEVDEFRRVVIGAVQVARRTQALTLLGHRPTHPETAFGWIRTGVEHSGIPGPGGPEGLIPFPGYFEVDEFVEKPPLAMAQALMADGALWNGGVFVWTIESLERAIQLLPGCQALMEAAAQGDDISDLWPLAEAVSVDRGLLERHPRKMVVPFDAGWSDLGNWEALAAVLPAREAGAVHAPDLVSLDATGNLIHVDGGLVVLAGVHDLVVVRAGDVTLVCPREEVAARVDAVRGIIALRGLGRYL